MPANGSSDREMNKAECWGRAVKEEGKSHKEGGGGCKDKTQVHQERGVSAVCACFTKLSLHQEQGATVTGMHQEQENCSDQRGFPSCTSP